MVRIDGRVGEGGGQVLRTSLALSLVTGEPLVIDHIRARRPKPGLRRQHLAAVVAAAEVGRGRLEGAELGSTSVEFRPRGIASGNFRLDVGTAGSTTLVLQTVLPALLGAEAPSRVTLEGGTHNPLAPPFEFLDRAFLPLLRKMGADVEAVLDRTGFFPAGGGRIVATIRPSRSLQPLDLLERGKARSRKAEALLSRLPPHIASRELEVLKRELALGDDECVAREVPSPGPGNALLVTLQFENVTEVFSAFGKKGLPAEEVALQAAREAKEYLACDVPVGIHLADQLLLPLALAGEGSFRTLPLSRHATTNIDVIRAFLPSVAVTSLGDRVRVETRG